MRISKGATRRAARRQMEQAGAFVATVAHLADPDDADDIPAIVQQAALNMLRALEDAGWIWQGDDGPRTQTPTQARFNAVVGQSS